MRWIKHPSTFCHSAAMTDVLETLGPSGYGVTWLLLERIAAEWDGKTEPGLQLSHKSWKKASGLSTAKLQELLQILKNHGIIFSKSEENKTLLTAPILLELLDEWTSRTHKNSGVSPEPLPSDSRIQTEQQSKVYEEQNKTHPPAANLRVSLVAVLSRHEIPAESDRGRRLIRYVEQKQPRNPGGYLERILQEKPHFDPAPADSYRPDAAAESGGATSADHVIRKLGLLR